MAHTAFHVLGGGERVQRWFFFYRLHGHELLILSHEVPSALSLGLHLRGALVIPGDSFKRGCHELMRFKRDIVE